MADNAYIYRPVGNEVELNVGVLTAGGVQFCPSPSMMIDAPCTSPECPCVMKRRETDVIIETDHDPAKSVALNRDKIQGGARVMLQRRCGDKVVVGAAQVTNGVMTAGSMMTVLFNALVEGGVDIRAVKRAEGAGERQSCRVPVVDEGYESSARM